MEHKSGGPVAVNFPESTRKFQLCPDHMAELRSRYGHVGTVVYTGATARGVEKAWHLPTFEEE